MYREAYECLVGEIQEQMEEVFETKDTLTDYDYKDKCDTLQLAYNTTVSRFGEEEMYLAEVREEDISRTTLEDELSDVENICVEMMWFSWEMLCLEDDVIHLGRKNWKYKTNKLWWQYRTEN